MIILKMANKEYAEQLQQFKTEVLEMDAGNENQFAGCMGLSECDEVTEWIDICNLRKSSDTCKQAGAEVPSTTYFAIRETDDKLVGVIDLRHHIEHPILGTWGGHCGYTVRPSERGNGYAKEMLRLNIENARQMGIRKLLVTCEETNIGSEKTILANRGVFENYIDINGFRMKRHWITVTDKKEE